MRFHGNLHPRLLCMAAVILLGAALARGEGAEPVSPKKGVIRLFNGKNLDGLYTWLQDAKYEDPRKVFTVENGLLHISGDGMGYVCTKAPYKNYHLVAEYRWGTRTWRSRIGKARDSGIIVHCAGPDGSAFGVFMAGIEAQIIEGGTGDILVVPGKREDGSTVSVALTAEFENGPKDQKIWKKGAPRQRLQSGRINWFGRDPEWKDVVDFRGKNDIQSPGQEWTRLDVTCDGGHIVYRVNGILVNEGFESSPAAGKILIQSEGAEVFYRRIELHPLKKK